ncbi:hypothetical protein SDJN03_22259, partial [Cucurbita argyrosperma subsp. sororia]
MLCMRRIEIYVAWRSLTTPVDVKNRCSSWQRGFLLKSMQSVTSSFTSHTKDNHLEKVQDLINYAHCRQKSKQPIKMVKGEIKFNSQVMKHFKVSVAPAKENFTTARLKLISLAVGGISIDSHMTCCCLKDQRGNLANPQII